MGVPLIETLVEGEVYRVEFYLSMSDSMWYASKNVGAYFSVLPPGSDIDSIESYQPQVRYNGDFITDKEGWTRVSGSFVAQGGERFLSIGNFDKYEDTEVLFVSGGGVNPWHSDVYWSCSEYFIDDVSVVPDSITGINEELEMSNEELSLYPNPNQGTFTVQLPLAANQEATMEVWNVSGQLVYSKRLYPGSNRLQLNVADGLYLYRVMVNREPKWLGKISIGSE